MCPWGPSLPVGSIKHPLLRLALLRAFIWGHWTVGQERKGYMVDGLLQVQRLEDGGVGCPERARPTARQRPPHPIRVPLITSYQSYHQFPGAPRRLAISCTPAIICRKKTTRCHSFWEVSYHAFRVYTWLPRSRPEWPIPGQLLAIPHFPSEGCRHSSVQSRPIRSKCEALSGPIDWRIDV